MKTYTISRYTLYFICSAFILSVSCAEELDVMPKLNTINATDADITSTTAALKGEVLIVGNMKIIDYGIELSESQLFSPSTRKGFDTAPVAGTYQVDFTGLKPNTLYYYKAYVTINTAQVYSQNAAHFTTKP